MDDLLPECIERFGKAPREFSRWGYMRVPTPWWLGFERDEIRQVSSQASRVFRIGVVIWGFVIQANPTLWRFGLSNCPGEVVFSFEPLNFDLDYLQGVARSLHALKNTEPNNPQLAYIADYLTDETIRVFGLPVPKVISPRLACKISTTLFVRKHLPQRRLCKPLLPLVVDPQPPHVALPLPGRYWPQELLDWWTG